MSTRRSSCFVLVALSTACFSPEVGVGDETDAGPMGSSTAGTGGVTGGPGDSTTVPMTTGTTAGSEESDSSGTTTLGMMTGTVATTASESCGDGTQDPNEDCDDGNEVVGDGCNPDCRVSGEVIWETTVHEGDDRATSLSIDTDDEIFVVGLVGSGGSAEFSNWWRRYNPDGDALETGALPRDFSSLRIAINGSAEEHQYVGVAVAAEGGSSFNGYPLEVGLFASDFTPAWTAELQIQKGLLQLQEEVVGEAVCRGDGGVVVGGGYRQGPAFGYLHRGFLSVFDSGGGLTESELLPPGEGAYASGCPSTALAPDGSYATLCYLDRESPWRIERYSEGGRLVYTREVSAVSPRFVSWLSGAPDNGNLKLLTLSAAGAVALAVPTGSSGTLPENTEVVVFDSNGSPAWEETLVGAGSLWIRDVAFTLDEGLVLVGETADARGTAGQQMLVQRFSSTGEPLWSDESGGTADTDDRLRAVEVDSEGMIVVLGEAENNGTQRDLVLRKYTP